ncbi:LysE family transporter [Olleya sp. R77988]|uniref:LysE family transporter n=1 Tax=Olleya sp. R77988 TaxID=3093875 RepID=UPI0037C8185D
MLVAFVGVIPPGLLNMTAAKIGIKEGYSRGLTFSIGVCVVVVIQTLIAVTFARYLSKHPEIVQVLQRVAFVIFVLITIYFLLLAKKEQKEILKEPRKSKHSQFFYGMFLSALNVFPIPYQAYMSIALASLGWLTFDNISITSYVAGAATGTFVMLYLYVFFFKRLKSKRLQSQKTMNYIIGGITGIISIITLINIINTL